MDNDGRAERLQDAIIARAWGHFEELAPQAIKDNLVLVPSLRGVVETGIHLGYSAALEQVMEEERGQMPKYKGLMSDLHELVSLARRTNKRVVGLRALERLLVRYR